MHAASLSSTIESGQLQRHRFSVSKDLSFKYLTMLLSRLGKWLIRMTARPKLWS